eukprot:264945-Chlamydomonas_euryale.AAC.4
MQCMLCGGAFGNLSKAFLASPSSLATLVKQPLSNRTWMLSAKDMMIPPIDVGSPGKIAYRTQRKPPWTTAGHGQH